MSIFGPQKTALSPSGVPGKPEGPKELEFMINIALSLQVAGSFIGDFCHIEGPLQPSQIALQGDGDIIIVVTALDPATGLPVDLSTATGLTILVQKPDLTVLSFAAVRTTNGRLGQFQAALGPANLDQEGYYAVQGRFTISAVQKSTVQGPFIVEEALEETPT